MHSDWRCADCGVVAPFRWGGRFAQQTFERVVGLPPLERYLFIEGGAMVNWAALSAGPTRARNWCNPTLHTSFPRVLDHPLMCRLFLSGHLNKPHCGFGRRGAHGIIRF